MYNIVIKHFGRLYTIQIYDKIFGIFSELYLHPYDLFSNWYFVLPNPLHMFLHPPHSPLSPLITTVLCICDYFSFVTFVYLFCFFKCYTFMKTFSNCLSSIWLISLNLLLSRSVHVVNSKMSYFWLNNISLYITSSLSIHPLMDK